MSTPKISASSPANSTKFTWSWFSGRRGLLIIAALVLVGGMVLNWSWLLAAGIAPILIAALPCLVMCGLGLCMTKMTGGSCESEQSATSTPHPDFADIERSQKLPSTETMRRQTSTPPLRPEHKDKEKPHA